MSPRQDNKTKLNETLKQPEIAQTYVHRLLLLEAM